MCTADVRPNWASFFSVPRIRGPGRGKGTDESRGDTTITVYVVGA